MPRHTHPRNARARRLRGVHRIPPEQLVINASATLVATPHHGHKRASYTAARAALSQYVTRRVQTLAMGV